MMAKTKISLDQGLICWGPPDNILVGNGFGRNMWEFARWFCINKLADRYNFSSFFYTSSHTVIIMWFGGGEFNGQ